jgi:hypothetical protein
MNQKFNWNEQEKTKEKTTENEGKCRKMTVHEKNVNNKGKKRKKNEKQLKENEEK